MAEYIEREAALAALCSGCDKMVPSDEREPCRYRFTGCMEYYNIFALAAADVVEVVRCKDCKYCIKEDDYEFWCNGFCSPARLVNPEDFCSHGFNKSELCCCLNGTSEEAEAAIERGKARIGRVNNG